MVITILSQIYCNTEADNMVKVALVLFTGMLMAAAFGPHVVLKASQKRAPPIVKATYAVRSNVPTTPVIHQYLRTNN
jgi:hypothetical protein